jgi:hypothetical protein
VNTVPQLSDTCCESGFIAWTFFARLYIFYSTHLSSHLAGNIKLGLNQITEPNRTGKDLQMRHKAESLPTIYSVITAHYKTPISYIASRATLSRAEMSSVAGRHVQMSEWLHVIVGVTEHHLMKR